MELYCSSFNFKETNISHGQVRVGLSRLFHEAYRGNFCRLRLSVYYGLPRLFVTLDLAEGSALQREKSEKYENKTL